ncbi:PGPGW domain-containing protein [Intrasporangium sp. DVR]|uniref:PGPGW domain-containing protein n=1 Tax=Intrasporangium sp. DVR TaxID=3127867 RepID=UPI00313A5B88
MLKAVLIVGLAVSVAGVLMIASPGPGYLVLALGIAIVAGSGPAGRTGRQAAL